MLSFPNPSLHPLRDHSSVNRIGRALLLSSVCTDYEKSVQVLVSSALKAGPTSQRRNGEALLAITGAREVWRIAQAAKAELMAIYGDTEISVDGMPITAELENELEQFQNRHPHLKQARDTIAHIDEYISSNGRNPEQWFDTNDRLTHREWLFRIGNKLDVDMVQLASDIGDLAVKVREAVKLAGYIEVVMAEPSEFVETLMKKGVYASLEVKGQVWDLTINSTDYRPSSAPKE